MVVFFYGNNRTSGARNAVSEYQKALARFKEMDVIVVGLSPDSLDCHRKLAAQSQLDFPLLADRDAKVATKYGAWRLRKNGGREYYGIVRSTIVVDPSGKISRLWDNVRVKGHLPKVKKYLAEVLAD
jgi:peroxiredoxin Q/BCP